MTVASASGDAPVHLVPVILKIHEPDGFTALIASDLANSVEDIFSLLRRRHQTDVSILPHRHIMEIPGELDALADQEIQKFIAGHSLDIFLCITNGGPVDQAAPVHQLHGICDLSEGSCAAARIGGLFETFNAHDQDDVPAPADILAELLVNQGSVGENHETAVGMLFCQTNDIAPTNQRFPAGHGVFMNPELLSLRNNAVHVLITEVQRMLVFRRPAAGALHVARTGRIEQNDPRNRNVQLLSGLLALPIAGQCSFVSEGQKNPFQELSITRVQQPTEEICPFTILTKRCSESIERFRRPRIPEEFLHCVHNTDKSLFTGVL